MVKVIVHLNCSLNIMFFRLSMLRQAVLESGDEIIHVNFCVVFLYISISVSLLIIFMNGI